MKFSHITAVAIATLLSAPALACKCYVNGNTDNGRTHSCCDKLHGVFRDGNDCLASSISDHLSNFRSCCGGNSDCDYPKLTRDKEKGTFTTIVVVPTAAALD